MTQRLHRRLAMLERTIGAEQPEISEEEAQRTLQTLNERLDRIAAGAGFGGDVSEPKSPPRALTDGELAEAIQQFRVGVDAMIAEQRRWAAQCAYYRRTGKAWQPGVSLEGY